MKNKVELIGIYGDDLTHACSAWTSTSRELSEEKLGRVDKLLTMLATEGHHTPFEKSSIHFLVTTEIATHIQILKHRIGVSVNGESARYKELKDDKAYLPVDWPEDLVKRLEDFQKLAFDQYHQMIKDLVARGFSKKRAKESARFFLPYSNQLTADVMFNFRSFAHFIGLRADDQSQLEIKMLGQEMLRLVKQTGKFDISIRAFGFEKYL
jgi:flavin-dependent thymidylate synthase